MYVEALMVGAMGLLLEHERKGFEDACSTLETVSSTCASVFGIHELSLSTAVKNLAFLSQPLRIFVRNYETFGVVKMFENIHVFVFLGYVGPVGRVF